MELFNVSPSKSPTSPPALSKREGAGSVHPRNERASLRGTKQSRINSNISSILLDLYFNRLLISFIFLFLIGFVSCQSNIEQTNEDEVFCNRCEDGDFVFVSADSTSFDDAIVHVTTDSSKRHNFSHVGLVHVTDSGIFVIEAITKGVVYTPIETFVEKNTSANIYLARLKDKYRKYIPQAICTAYSHVGKAYDFSFDLTNDTYYCSELIYLAFVAASGDSLFFDTPPMTFKADNSNEYYPYWITYFEDLNMDIPEGQPGLNPNGMSLSEKLTFSD